MTACGEFTRSMLRDPVDVKVDSPALDLKSARDVADGRAAELAADPMLIAWYDAKTGMFSPTVECCSEEKPGWLVYAESRGGDLVIDVNKEEYVFVYHRGN